MENTVKPFDLTSKQTINACKQCGRQYVIYKKETGRSNYCSRLCKSKSMIGNSKYWLGKSRSAETNRKISLTKIGVPSPMKGKRIPKLVGNTNGFREGMVPWNRGKPMDPKLKERLVFLHEGKPLSSGVRRKISIKLSGENAPNWQGGKTSESQRVRGSFLYRYWRSLVFRRDDYTCQVCGAKSGKGKPVYLNAHHKSPFSGDRENRFKVENGITLCISCHRLFATTPKNYGLNITHSTAF